MSRRRRRPRIPVTLVLPADPPTQDEIDAVLMATDSIIGRAGRADSERLPQPKGAGLEVGQVARLWPSPAPDRRPYSPQGGLVHPPSLVAHQVRPGHSPAVPHG